MKSKKNQIQVLPEEKYLLSVSEAALYFNICEKKIRSILKNCPDADLAVMNGRNLLIRRKKFETFLDSRSEI